MELNTSHLRRPKADRFFLLAVLAGLVGGTLFSGGMMIGLAAGFFEEAVVEVAQIE